MHAGCVYLLNAHRAAIRRECARHGQHIAPLHDREHSSGHGGSHRIPLPPSFRQEVRTRLCVPEFPRGCLCRWSVPPMAASSIPILGHSGPDLEENEALLVPVSESAASALTGWGGPRPEPPWAWPTSSLSSRAGPTTYLSTFDGTWWRARFAITAITPDLPPPVPGSQDHPSPLREYGPTQRLTGVFRPK